MVCGKLLIDNTVQIWLTYYIKPCKGITIIITCGMYIILNFIIVILWMEISDIIVQCGMCFMTTFGTVQYYGERTCPFTCLCCRD